MAVVETPGSRPAGRFGNYPATALVPRDLEGLPPLLPERSRPGADVVVGRPRVGRRRRRFVEGITNAGHVVLDLLIAVVLGGLTWWIGWRGKDFRSFPKGYDALGHQATIELVLRNFPHFAWNYAWYGGFPAFPGSYPPLYTLAAAAVVSATGCRISTAMLGVAAGIYVVAALSCYGFVRVLGRNRLAAIAATVLLLAVPSLWAQSIMNGLYPRLTAMALSDLATFFVALDAKKPSRPRLAAAGALLAGAYLSHPVIAVIGTVQVLGVALLVPRTPFETRLRRSAAIGAITAGLCAWFYIPYFWKLSAYYLAHPVKLLVHGQPIPISLLFHPGKVPLAWLPAALIPSFVVLVVLALLLRMGPMRRRRERGPLAVDPPTTAPWYRRRLHLSQPLAVAGALALVAAGCLLYGQIGHLGDFRIYLFGINPIDVLAYAAWPLAAGAGVLLASVVGLLRRRFRPVVGLAAVCGAAAVLWSVSPTYAVTNVDGHNPDQQALIDLLPKGAHHEMQYRVGGTIDPVTDWINTYTDAPENRGYFDQGVLHPNSQDWLLTEMASPTVGSGELRFLLDWYDIRWLYAGAGPQGWVQYQSRPKLFKELAETSVGPPYRTYGYADAPPILSAGTVPAALVIGSPIAFDYVLRGLAPAGAGPQTVIPVEGRSSLADYSLAELERFPVLVLYDAEFGNLHAAAAKLAAYVRHGGGLVVEAAGTNTELDALARDGAPLPVRHTTVVSVAGSWEFTVAQATSPLLRDVDLSQFGPPLYGVGDPWSTVYATGLSSGARVVLESQGKPAVVTSRYGRGRVVWSGLNLPYHIAVFGDPPGSELLANAVLDAAGGSHLVQSAGAGKELNQPSSGPADVPCAVNEVGSCGGAPGARLTADSATVIAPAGASEVVFHEDDYPDWHATVDGKAVPILPAGPGMQMVALRPSSHPQTVRFYYELSAREIGADVVTVVAACVLVAWLVGLPTAGLRRRWRQLLRKLDLAA